MPVKTEPVPVSEQPEDKEKEAEPEEAAQEEVPKAEPKRRAKKAVIAAPEEPLPAEPEHEEPKPKARAKRAPKAKAEPKAPKPKKEPKPKATKQDCTVCNTTVGSEALLTSHACSKSALAAKKKRATLEEEAPPPPDLLRYPMNARERTNWVQSHPNEAFPYDTAMPEEQHYGAPPTFVGDFAKGIGDLSIPERRLTYREALETKYKEYQHQKRASMLGPLRRAYG